MSKALRIQIENYAAAFASELLKAIRGASLEDILAESAAAPSLAATASGGAGRGSSGIPAKRGPGRPRKDATLGSTKASPSKATTNGERLARRSKDEIAKALRDVVALVRKKPNLRAEAIRASLEMDRRELPRVLAEGIAKKVLSKKGEKRATTYRAVS